MSSKIFATINRDFNIPRHRRLFSYFTTAKNFSTNSNNLSPDDILNIVKFKTNNYSIDSNFIEFISKTVIINSNKWDLSNLSDLTTTLVRRYLTTNVRVHQNDPLYNLYNIIHSRLLNSIDELPISTTAKAAEALKLFNKLPIETARLLTRKLHDSLLNNAKTIDTSSLGNILWAIDTHVSADFLHVLLKNLTSLHHLYPKLPETWIVYMRFIAKRRFHSKEFLLEMAKRLITILNNYKNLKHKLSEMIPTIAWSYAIIFPLRASNLFKYKQKEIDIITNLYTTLVNKYLEDDIGSYVLNGGIVRLAWSLSVQDMLCNYPEFIESLQPNLSNNIEDRRHATMLYYSMRYLQIKSPHALNNLLPIYEQCTNLLKNTPRIKPIQPSKTQRLVSEILNSWHIPHKFEFTTPELVSVDISIESALYGEKIAIEVDGPWHFLTLHNPQQSVRTGPSFFKHWLLESEGWNVISLKPPSFNVFDASDNHGESTSELAIQKDKYRKALLSSNSKYLSLLL